jgi:hypothetical protein
MADDQTITGGFSHAGQPRRDGFYDTLHPETGERLLLTRVENADSKASVADWGQTFATLEALGAVSPTAWWPIVRQGVDGEVAFAAFAPWKSTLSQDLAKGYRCKSAELLALAECLADGLGQLQATAQRPHGALRPDCIVFPRSAGDEHDSLSPRLTGLVPLEETDPREQDDRRRLGHLLYAAITGAETNFRGVPDFGIAWADVDLPGKNSWKKLIEELTSGNLDNVPYDQIRLRLGKGKGGKFPVVPIIAGVVVVALAAGGWILLKKKPDEPDKVERGGSDGSNALVVVPATNPLVIPKTNPPVVVVKPVVDPPPTSDEPWLANLKTNTVLQEALSIRRPMSKGSVESQVRRWWDDVPTSRADAWIRLDFPRPLQLTLDAGTPGVLLAEVTRRRAFQAEAARLPQAQKDLEEEVGEWVQSLGWNQRDIQGLIRTQVLLGASNALRSKTLVFSRENAAVEEYPRAMAGATNAPHLYPVQFKGWPRGWAELTTDQKVTAATHLRDIWRNDLKAWVEFEPPKLEGPEARANELRAKAREKAIQASVFEPSLGKAKEAFDGVNAQCRLRRFRNREDAQQAVKAAVEGPLKAAEAAIDGAAVTLAQQKAAQERAQRLTDLQEKDKELVRNATTAANLPGGVRKAREELRKLIEAEKVKAAGFDFNFPGAEGLWRQLEDRAWVEEARATVDRTSTNSLATVRSDLERKLQPKLPSEYPESRKYAQELQTERTTLIAAAEKKAMQDAELARQRADQEAETARQRAAQDDLDRAAAAQTTAKTNVQEAIRALEEKLKTAPGSATNQSFAALVELREVQGWLANLPAALKVEEPGWVPPAQDPVRKPTWGGLKQVDDRYTAYDRLKGIWAEAKISAERLDRLETAQEFQNLNTRLSDPALQNKAFFNEPRTKVSSALPEVTRGEGLRTRSLPGDAAGLSAYITEVDTYLKEPKPAYPYFTRLGDELKQSAERARTRVADLAKEGQEKQRLAALKANVVGYAKAAGVDVFGVDNPSVRGMKAATAKRYREQLAASRTEIIGLLTKLEPGTDRAAVEKQLDRLDSTLKGFEATGD